MKIGIKLPLAFLIMTLSIIVISYIAADAAQKELETSIGTHSVSISRGIIDHIDSEISNRIEDFQVFATRPTWIEFVNSSNAEFGGMEDVQGYINRADAEWVSVPGNATTPFMDGIIGNWMSGELRKRIDFYESKHGYRVCGEIFMTNMYGALIAASGKTSDYRQDDEEWWQLTKEGGTYISGGEFDESSGIYSITISVAVKDDDGRFIGVMKAVINVEEGFSILEETVEKSKYDSLRYKLLKGNGEIIYDSEGNFRLLEDVYGEDFFRRMGGEGGYFLGVEDNGKSEKLFAFARSKGFGDYNGSGWILVAEYDSAEALGPVENLRDTLLLSSILGIALSASIGFFVYNTVSRPLKRLSENIMEIGKGAHGKRVSINSRDEIGELASSFNRMSSDLESYNKRSREHEMELKRCVDERTQELDRKIREIEETKAAILNMMEDVDQTNKDLMDAQGRLRASIEELKEVDAKKDEFISIAAHELKTPLTAIHGFSQLLKDDKVSADRKKRENYLNIMDKETRRLADLVNDILELSRIDLGTIRMSREKVSLHEIINTVKSEMEVAAKEKGLKLGFAVGKNIPSVSTDREKFTQVLLNVINNAIKYTDRGRIDVTVSREGSDIMFSVKDTGIGIEKKDIKKIFERFYQADSSYTREAGGTGLGLALVREYIGLLGGRIWVESVPGKGSEFRLTLPVGGMPEGKKERIMKDLKESENVRKRAAGKMTARDEKRAKD